MLKVLFCNLTIVKMRIIGYPLHKWQVIFFISDSWVLRHTLLHGVLYRAFLNQLYKNLFCNFCSRSNKTVGTSAL